MGGLDMTPSLTSIYFGAGLKKNVQTISYK
jgi:hypothetical protein